jgi:hypothetical protein
VNQPHQGPSDHNFEPIKPVLIGCC